MKGWSKTAWTGALLLSLLVHGGAAALLAGREDDVQIAGGNPVDIAVLGNSFEDALSAGEYSEVLETETPTADQPTEVDSDVAESAEAAVAEAVEPDHQSVMQPSEVVEAEVSPVAEPTVTETEGTVAVPSVETVEPEPSELATRSEAVQASEAEVVPETQAAPAESREPEMAEAVEPDETINPVADAPIPMPRPDIEALKAEEARREAERRAQAQRQQAARQQQAPRQEPARAASGAGGANQADARRGDAAGSAQGRSAQSSGQEARPPRPETPPPRTIRGRSSHGCAGRSTTRPRPGASRSAARCMSLSRSPATARCRACASCAAPATGFSTRPRCRPCNAQRRSPPSLRRPGDPAGISRFRWPFPAERPSAVAPRYGAGKGLWPFTPATRPVYWDLPACRAGTRPSHSHAKGTILKAS